MNRMVLGVVGLGLAGCTTAGAVYHLPDGSEKTCSRPRAWVWAADVAGFAAALLPGVFVLPASPALDGIEAYAGCKSAAEAAGGTRVSQ